MILGSLVKSRSRVVVGALWGNGEGSNVFVDTWGGGKGRYIGSREVVL